MVSNRNRLKVIVEVEALNKCSLVDICEDVERWFRAIPKNKVMTFRFIKCHGHLRAMKRELYEEMMEMLKELQTNPCSYCGSYPCSSDCDLAILLKKIEGEL